MTETTALSRWPTGAWFGTQLGGTAYLLTGAADMAGSAPAVAAVWAGCFLAANAAGTWLWRRQARGRWMLLACGTAATAAVAAWRLSV